MYKIATYEQDNRNTGKSPYTAATQNACKLCTPLGASLAFKGVANAICLLHGSQGCSTYIRRYLISHFKEPIDIASSNFSEETAIFGGGRNLKLAIDNLRKQYQPDVLGIATTCLSETIGDDASMIIKEYRSENALPDYPIVHVSTPSFKGTHFDGFHAAVKAMVDTLALPKKNPKINVFPGMLSCADIRYLKEILTDFGAEYTVLPDYSETLNGGLWESYQRIPEGGTPIGDIRKMGGAKATIEFGNAVQDSAALSLDTRFGVPFHKMGIPIGVNETDIFLETMSDISGRPIPRKYEQERGRLVDAYIDGHKYVSHLKAVIYGEEDFVVGMAAFLHEIGMIPILCASGGKSGRLSENILERLPDMAEKNIQIIDGADFVEIENAARCVSPDIIIGNSKGYPMSRRLNVPMIRIGFPVHDRFNGGRILHVGYRGAQELFDRIVNTVMAHRQESSEVGYSYL